MPSRKKTSMFMAGFLASVGSFVLVCTSLGTQDWVSSRIAFTELSANNASGGYVSLAYGLFEGKSQTIYESGLGIPESTFQVLKEARGTDSAEIVHILIIVLLVAGLFCSLLSSGITCYNSVSNPYQTFFGPIGVYVWSVLNGSFILLALILGAVNTEVNKFPERLIKKNFKGETTFSQQNSYGYSFWLLLVIILLNGATIVIIYLYHHARYSERREQQRPMENAPKDIILF
ncbi:clarin-3 [Lissotriton helveticus]